MKHNKLFLLPLIGMILIGCGNNETTPNENEPPIVIDDGGNTGGNEGQGTGGEGTGGNTPTYVKDELTSPIAPGEMLPIGNVVVEGPSNISNPDEISTEKTYNMYSSMPSNWTYIMGNNKQPGKEDFYSSTAGGGLKFSHLWYGVQSCAFKTYKYTYVSFKVSSVNNCNDGASSAPIFHIYGYDKDSNCILQKNVEQGAIKVSTKGNYVNVEIHNDQMTYFEMRLNANPSVGQQAYNFGISEVKIRGNN